LLRGTVVGFVGVVTYPGSELGGLAAPRIEEEEGRMREEVPDEEEAPTEEEATKTEEGRVEDEDSAGEEAVKEEGVERSEDTVVVLAGTTGFRLCPRLDPRGGMAVADTVPPGNIAEGTDVLKEDEVGRLEEVEGGMTTAPAHDPGIFAAAFGPEGTATRFD
jgi:hypothetical protein